MREERQKRLNNAVKDDKFDVKLVKINDKSKYCINPEVYQSNIVKISKINTTLQKRTDVLKFNRPVVKYTMNRFIDMTIVPTSKDRRTTGFVNNSIDI